MKRAIIDRLEAPRATGWRYWLQFTAVAFASQMLAFALWWLFS